MQPTPTLSVDRARLAKSTGLRMPTPISPRTPTDGASTSTHSSIPGTLRNDHSKQDHTTAMEIHMNGRGQQGSVIPTPTVTTQASIPLPTQPSLTLTVPQIQPTVIPPLNPEQSLPPHTLPIPIPVPPQTLNLSHLSDKGLTTLLRHILSSSSFHSIIQKTDMEAVRRELELYQRT